MATGKKDPMAQLNEMIEAAVEGAMKRRDDDVRAEKDPAYRIQKMIDEAVGRHFEAFAKGLEEGRGAGAEGGSEPGEEGANFGDILEGIFKPAKSKRSA